MFSFWPVAGNGAVTGTKPASASLSEGAAPVPAKASEASQNSESSGYVTSSNAKINGTSEAAVNGIGKDKNDNKIEPVKSTETNLKCLEDPTFSFDEPKSSSLSSRSIPPDTTAKPSETQEVKAPEADNVPVQQQPKKPSYRVLEDPDLDIIPTRPGTWLVWYMQRAETWYDNFVSYTSFSKYV